MVDAIGWEAFFWSTMVLGIPGLVLLQRFAPLGTRDPHFTVEEPRHRKAMTTGDLVRRGVLWGTLGFAASMGCVALMSALRTASRDPEIGFDFGASFLSLLSPAGIVDWLQIAGLLIFGAVVGLCAAAIGAARHGAGTETT